MSTERPRPRVGDIVFDVYGDSTHPFVDVETGARYAEHEPIGMDPVRQRLGSKLAEIVITGECTLEEAKKIDKLEEKGEIEVRTHRWSGVATVENTSTPAKKKKSSEKGWIYDYKITLKEV